MNLIRSLLAFFILTASALAAPVLDARKFLEAQEFWVNQDLDWFERQIPIFDCPDAEINTTYYYRWELVTRHLVYGNPNFGYAFTEFANRPFWSGAYGTISCPAGHQIYEVRWLHDPRYVRDYVRFWMRHPGAQPRNYSFWAADSAWAAHQVHPHVGFVKDLLPDLINNYQQWESRCWVEEMGMFWQLGHDDGMEFDINAQQTKDILRGGQSLRPSFNAYMWADAQAIARIAALSGETEAVEKFRAKAARIKSQVEAKLWDPKRQFFFPMSNQEHEKDGHVVKKHTLTYESGQFAGSPHGRELHGYVPWAFNLPGAGFEGAWKFLVDEAYFKAPFGPSTVERNDPLFALKDSCCWWSGQSWPFATTQTLKAMANLLQGYQQGFVGRSDYADLLHTFAITHRKDGKPYIAEAIHPITGSWDGHDIPNRSEHYFHSGFTDLVITGLVGLIPAAGDQLTIHPLAPDSWDYFALDGVMYHGHLLTILWDRTGERYGAGEGFQILVDGERVGGAPRPGKLTVTLPAAKIIPIDERPPMNFAVNNDGDYFPRYRASSVDPGSSLAAICDGQFVYDTRPANRWTSAGGASKIDWVEVDFGIERALDSVKLYVLDDAGKGEIQAPAKIELEFWDGASWKPVPGQGASAATPLGRRPHSISFPELQTGRLRALIHHDAGARCGLTEFEAWGPGTAPYVPAPPPAGNIAYNPDGQGFPKVSASHSDRFGGEPRRAIDGKIVFAPTPMNRWTCYESKTDSDWLELEFAEEVEASSAVLHIYDDRGGVQAPKDYHLESWTGSGWQTVPGQIKDPATPTGNMANTVSFPKISFNKLRVVFTHAGAARSGVTELEVWKG